MSSAAKPASITPNNLSELLDLNSKHGEYQSIHPLLDGILPEQHAPAGKKEEGRQVYMEQHAPLSGKRVLDIGANTGYFSFAAIQAGAAKVVSIEGNGMHAAFIFEAGKQLNLADRLIVKNQYFDFHNRSVEHFDIALCLNVLHHVGDDFFDECTSIADAKKEILHSLSLMINSCSLLWLQLGYNWKGNIETPLFPSGRKEEIIEFVQDGVSQDWEVLRVAVFDLDADGYTDINAQNLERFDSLGEFLNRPLFLLKSKRAPL